MTNTPTMDTLVQQFAESVVAQTNAIYRGDVETSDNYARDRVKAFDALCEHGDRGREALTRLFTHERAQVRVRAAAYLLRYAHDRARAVLEAEARVTGLSAFEAVQALERWSEGTWELDPG